MRISDWSSDVCSSDLQGRFPDARFTADERCGTMHDPAAKNEIKLTQSGRHAGRHFHKAVERLHHDFGAATGQVMFCGKRRRLCRGILSYRVPLATIEPCYGQAGILDRKTGVEGKSE